ncbi:FHA domain-containing protein [Thermogemmatispora sp.]|uniref:protein kinase domain-containing protein n=1 Tax=Thermogemmatispora sp. TaxID=1968838 RepID=UPI0035E4559A
MPALREGQRFERYRVIRLLGSGLAGESYEAEDTLLLRKVVLKLLHPWAPLSDAARRQFFREMQGISQLTHRYLAPVLDYGELHGNLYVARRLFSSGSLLNSDGRLWFSPPLELSAAVSYAQQLAQALQHVHAAGYLHGGLSLTNIMVLRGPNVEGAADYAPFMLADVGLAHFVRRFGRLQRPILPVTAAPEQLGGRATQASDQFALAVIVYTWIAGRPPYLGLPEEIAQAKLSESFPSLLSLNPQVPVAIEGVIRRALSVYPEDRYPTVLAFAEALLQALPRRATLAERQTAPVPPQEPADERPASAPPGEEEEMVSVPGPEGLEMTAAYRGEPAAVAREELPAASPPVSAAEMPAEPALPEEESAGELEALAASSPEEAAQPAAPAASRLAVQAEEASSLPVAPEPANETANAGGETPALEAREDRLSLTPALQLQQEPGDDQRQALSRETELSGLQSFMPVSAAPQLPPAQEPAAIEATTKRTSEPPVSGSALTYFEALLQATQPPGTFRSDLEEQAVASPSPAMSVPEALPPGEAAIAAGQEPDDRHATETTLPPTLSSDLPQTPPTEVSLLEVLSGLHGQSSTTSLSLARAEERMDQAASPDPDQAPSVDNGPQVESLPEEAALAAGRAREEGQAHEGERATDERAEAGKESTSTQEAEAVPAWVLVLPPATAARQATIVELVAPEVSIGRAGDSGILLEGDCRVSRRHAFLRRMGTDLLIQDGDNAEGVFVNGQRLAQGGSQVLRPGDQIHIGDHELIVCQSREEAQRWQQERVGSNGQDGLQGVPDSAASSSSAPGL